jgi:predicted enzyme related to lactoylglutathione lyase
MITGVKFVGIPVKNQDKQLKFWTETMGFKVTTDQPLGKQRWIELRIQNSPTFVVLFTPDGQEDRVGTFFNGSFVCDDVEATYRQLSQKGVHFDQPPKREDWGTSAIFKDIEGNSFVLSSR